MIARFWVSGSLLATGFLAGFSAVFSGAGSSCHVAVFRPVRGRDGEIDDRLDRLDRLRIDRRRLLDVIDPPADIDTDLFPILP